MFVAVGHFGARITSADGETWGEPVLGKEGEVYRAVAFGNGRFVTVGSFGGENIMASLELKGGDWQTGKQDAKYSQYLRGLGFGKDFFLGLGGDPGAVGDSKPFVFASNDGVTWSESIPISGKNILRRLTFGKGLFVAVGDRGRRAASSDGREWKDAPDVKAIDTLVDIAFGNGRFVGVGLHGLRMCSEDGIAWTDRQLGEEGEHLNSIVWDGARFVAVGMGGTWFSPDGVKWTREPNTLAPLTMTFGGGMFVGANWRGRILRSTDAVTWREVHKLPHHLEAIAFGNLA